MEKKIYAIFVAGGSGQRMGTSTPKQFLDLAGRPVLIRTLQRFLEAIPDLQVLTVLPIFSNKTFFVIRTVHIRNRISKC